MADAQLDDVELQFVTSEADAKRVKQQTAAENTLMVEPEITKEGRTEQEKAGRVSSVSGDPERISSTTLSNEADHTIVNVWRSKNKKDRLCADYLNNANHVTPRNLMGCKENGLLKAIEVCQILRDNAYSRRAEEEKIKNLANSVEDFAVCLLDLALSEDRRAIDANCEEILEKATNSQMKKFLSHNEMFELLQNRWSGSSDSNTKGRTRFWWWYHYCFTFLWVVIVDILVLPLLFLLSFPLIPFCLCSGCFTECYCVEMFLRPLHVFVRDMLSYCVLLGLHYCCSLNLLLLESALPLLLMFFVGRFVMELEQFLSARRTTFKRKRLQYFRDIWNTLDLLILVIFIIFIIYYIFYTAYITEVRYIFGLNTVLLTLRVFGQTMETTRSMGVIQIALFQIIGDVVGILFQFLVVIVAFSFGITGCFVTEYWVIYATYSNATYGNVTHSSWSRGTDDLGKLICDKSVDSISSSLRCWFNMLGHLIWSLLGNTDQEKVMFRGAEILYAVFMILGVILLINMLIALLSSTYQRVQDNSFKEWTYKKALTVQTYTKYHPVPVPLNLISMPVLLLYRSCILLYRCCIPEESRAECLKEHPSKKVDLWQMDCTSMELLDKVIAEVGRKYFSSYGNAFPMGKDAKTDYVLKEMDRNRRLTLDVAKEIISTTGHGENIKRPKGSEVWNTSGIEIGEDGETLSLPHDVEWSEEFPCYNARYKVPFSRQNPKFEVFIQESDDDKPLVVGVVYEDHSDRIFPGWEDDTVGYQVNDGVIFDMFSPENPWIAATEDTAAHEGDTISVETELFPDFEGQISISFWINGRKVTETIMFPEGRDIYPCVAIGYSGARVKAKICSLEEEKNKTFITNIEKNREEIRGLEKTVAQQQQLLNDMHNMLSKLVNADTITKC